MRKLTIKDMDVFIELDGIITSIIGPTNSGKTVILKKLCHKIDNRDIKIDDVCIDEYDISFLKNNIVVCLYDNHFYEEYVAEELFHNLNLLGYRIDEITNAEVISSDIDDERESGSITNQKRFLKNFCNECGIDIFKIYTDDGYSGANFDRPRIQINDKRY